MLTEQQVSELSNSKSEIEWNSICDRIKKENGGKYPSDWFIKILASGLMSKTARSWAQ